MLTFVLSRATFIHVYLNAATAANQTIAVKTFVANASVTKQGVATKGAVDTFMNAKFTLILDERTGDAVSRMSGNTFARESKPLVDANCIVMAIVTVL